MPDAHREEIQKLEALYAEHPEGRIFTHLAEAYRKAGQLEQARSVLEDGIGRHPDYSSAHVVLGRVLMDQERAAEAESEFHRVLELDAHNMVALRSLGDLARREGRSEAALDYYHRLLEIEPADQDVRALVEEVQAGAAEPLEAWETDSEEAGWAPHGLVEGSTFEEAAWSLSEEAAAGDQAGDQAGSDWPAEGPHGAEAEEAEKAEEAEAPEAVEDDVLEGGWVPFGAAAGDAPALSGAGAEEGVQESAEEDHPAGDAAAEQPRTDEPGEDEPFPDWEAPEVGAGAGPQDPFATSGFAGTGAVDDDEEEPTPSFGSPGVMTETIAQVYARQGLYGQAAEVYRELVRERPSDAGLRDRLAEMEELAAHAAESRRSAGPAETEALEDEAPWGVEAFDAGAASEEGGGAAMEGLEPSELDHAEAEVAPLEGLETQDVDPDTHLVTGTAGAGADVEVPDEMDVRDVPEPPEEEPWASTGDTGGEEDAAADEAGATLDGPMEEPWGTEPEPSAAPAVPDEPWAVAPEPELVPEPAEEHGPAGEPRPAEAGAGAEPDPADGSVWTGAEWGEAEAESPYAWAEPEPEPEADETPPIERYFRGLLGWSGGAGSAGGSEVADAADTAEVTDAAAARDASGVGGGTEGASSSEAAEPSEPAAEDPEDDDLDMFRSWLESLKQ